SAAAAPAASTAASAAARTAIAIAGLIVADCALRFVGFVLIAFGIGGGNRLGALGQHVHQVAVLARRRSAFAGLVATAAAAAAAARAALAVAFALGGAGFFAGRPVVGEAFGLVGLDLGLVFEQLFLVVGLIDLRRRGGRLRGKQRLGGFERMDLLTAID